MMKFMVYDFLSEIDSFFLILIIKKYLKLGSNSNLISKNQNNEINSIISNKIYL